MTQITKITGYFGNYIHKSSAGRALRQAVGSEREALFPNIARRFDAWVVLREDMLFVEQDLGGTWRVGYSYTPDDVQVAVWNEDKTELVNVPYRTVEHWQDAHTPADKAGQATEKGLPLPPCPACGEELATPETKRCTACGSNTMHLHTQACTCGYSKADPVETTQVKTEACALCGARMLWLFPPQLCRVQVISSDSCHSTGNIALRYPRSFRKTDIA